MSMDLRGVLLVLIKMFVSERLVTLQRNNVTLATANLQRVYWVARCELCDNLHRNGLSRSKALALIVEHCMRHHDGSKRENTDYGK